MTTSPSASEAAVNTSIETARSSCTVTGATVPAFGASLTGATVTVIVAGSERSPNSSATLYPMVAVPNQLAAGVKLTSPAGVTDHSPMPGSLTVPSGAAPSSSTDEGSTALSMSVSLPATEKTTAPESSLIVALSATATGRSFTGATSTRIVAVEVSPSRSIAV